MSSHVIELGDIVNVLKDYEDNVFDAVLCDPPYGLSFMGRGWDTFGHFDVPMDFGMWLAGLIDGEGNFDIHRQQRDSGEYYYCRFEISLRADDGGILEMLRARLGGKVYDRRAPENGGGSASKRWELVSQSECARLASILDRYPLQSKKARDFAIWREALASSIERRGSPDRDGMSVFWQQLRATRPFAGPVTDSAVFRNAADADGFREFIKNAFIEVSRVLKPGGHIIAFSGTRTYHRMVCGLEDAGFEIRDCVAWMYGVGFPKSLNLDGTHEGYGTALKPAFEPAVLARKPLEGTVVENVTKWGVGALAIDACRIEFTDDVNMNARQRQQNADGTIAFSKGMVGTDIATYKEGGRWPANVILDEEAGAALDAQSGNHPGMSGGGKHKADYAGGMFGGIDGNASHARGDNGGASRFFYCPKASKKERDAGLEDMPVLSGGEMTDREDGSPGTQSPRAGAGRTGGGRNVHPTVKPIALCEYLARLIMPPQPGAILVPFAGSGSEMIGALKAGWPAVVGIERESAYVEIARRRLAHHGRAA